MKDIPEADLLRGQLNAAVRQLNISDAACVELRRALNAESENVLTLTEVVATMIHRAGEAGTTISNIERLAAFEACWLRVSLDFLVDDETEESSVRVSLMAPTADERKANADAIVEAAAAKEKADSSKLKLLSPDGVTPLD